MSPFPSVEEGKHPCKRTACARAVGHELFASLPRHMSPGETGTHSGLGLCYETGVPLVPASPEMKSKWDSM